MPTVPPAGAAFTGDLDAELSAAQRDELLAQARLLNPERAPEELTGMQRWDLEEYERPHLPVLVATVEDRAGFSRQRGIRILDMAVRKPDQGWALPEEYAPYRPVLAMAVAHERAINPEFDRYYVYLTVDQKVVEPRQSQRRPGWHGDAFVSSQTAQLADEAGRAYDIIVDHTYVVSDTLPTRFLPGPFSLKGVDPEDIPAVLARFDELAVGKTPRTYPPYALLRMTPYDVHSVSVNQSDAAVERTFVKIQFSRDKLNMRGNTLNPLFSYDDWQWVPRQPLQRNNRNTISGWSRPDADQFRLVNPDAVDFTAGSPGLPWLEPRFLHAIKTQGVWAERAHAGDTLETVVHGAALTFCIAQAGDWKITTSQGDSYFLSAKKFRRRYQAVPTADGWYLPIPVVTKMAIAREPIRFRAPWGAWQYIPAGSAVVNLGDDDLYGIHRSNFEASYTVVKAPPRRRQPPPLQPHQDFVDSVVENDGENGFAFFGQEPLAQGRIGLFTVTANPVHNGHLGVATQVKQRAGLDGLVIVLARRHVLKGDALEASAAERLAMLEATFEPADGFSIAVSTRGYYRDFVASFGKLRPDVAQQLVLGCDSVSRYVEITPPDEVEALFGAVERVVVAYAQGVAEPLRDALLSSCRTKLSAAAAAKLETVPVDDYGLSSTELRGLARGGGAAWASALPSGVADLIRGRQLYGTHREPGARRAE